MTQGSMKTVDFDAIAASAALDSAAGRVTARGEHWTPERPLPAGLQHWKSPPKLKAFVANPLDPSYVDMTGKKFGRFTVVGLWAAGPGWVVRCTCGDYEIKKARAVRSALAGLSPLNTPAFRCFFCAQWQIAQNRYTKHGSKPMAALVSAPERVIEARTPIAIIAEFFDEYADQSAVKVIAALMRAGYRIVKERQPNQDSTALSDHQQRD